MKLFSYSELYTLCNNITYSGRIDIISTRLSLQSYMIYNFALLTRRVSVGALTRRILKITKSVEKKIYSLQITQGIA